MITNPEDTGSVQPAHRRVRARSSTTPAACATTTRPTRTGSSGSLAPATPASTCASSTCTRRSPRRTARWACRSAPAESRAELAPFLPAPTVEFDGSRYRLDVRPAAVDRQDPRLPRRSRDGRALVRMGAQPRRRRPARGGRDRGAEQQLPGVAARRRARRGGLVRGGEFRPPSRADPLHPGQASRRTPASARSTSAGARPTSASPRTSPSHEPWVVPEPMTLEPSESYSRADLDDYAEIIATVAREAYETPETVLSVSAPQHGAQARPGAPRRSGALGAHLACLPAQVRRHGGFPAARRFDQRHDAGLTRG